MNADRQPAARNPTPTTANKPTPASGHGPILALVVFTLLHGLWYTALVHPWQSPDEYLHYEYIRLLDRKQAPVLGVEDREGDIQWEVAESMWAFQHYRYRLLPTFPEAVFRGIALPLGSGKAIFRPPLYFLLSLPIYWATATLPVLSQLYVLRLFSILLHGLTVWLTFLLARLVFKGAATGERLAISAAALLALHPQFTFIGAALNDDNLPPPLVAFALYALLRGAERRGAFRWYALAAVSGALALAAKRTAVAILPLLALGLVAYGIFWLYSTSRLQKAAGVLVVAGSILGLAVAAVALAGAPGLPLGLARALRVPMAALEMNAEFWREPARLLAVDWKWWLQFLIESFWGQFGWLTVRLGPGWLQAMIWASAVLAVGCGVGLVRTVLGSYEPRTRLWALAGPLMAAGVLVALLTMAAQFLVAPTAYAPQGRYLFPFIAPIAVLAVWGWLAWWPRRWQGAAAVLGLGLLLWFDTASWLTLASYFYS